VYEGSDGSIVLVMKAGPEFMDYARSVARIMERPEPLTIEDAIAILTLRLQPYNVSHEIARLPGDGVRVVRGQIALELEGRPVAGRGSYGPGTLARAV
jgi:hypothetical protein